MRFCGKIGYGESTETAPGVHENLIEERTYRGDVVRDIKRDEPGQNLNDDLVINNSISIVADRYANEHYHLIKYVEWQGHRWTVSAVEVKPPRLLLSIGRVYNGPTP